MSAYEAELAAALAAETETDTLGDEPVTGAESEEIQAEDEPVAEEVAEEQEEEVSDDEEVAEDEPEVKTKDRFRFKDPNDQKVAAVAKAMGVSLIEAAKIVEGQTTTKHQDSEAEPEARESVAEVTATIKDLQTQKKEKLAALEFEAAAELDEQIDTLRDKRDDLKASEAREKSLSEQRAADKFYADYAENEAKTVKFYPDAAKADSPMGKEMARLEAEMLALGDPLYHSAGKPFALAKAAAINLGIPMTNPNKSPVAKKAAANRPIQPASGNARTTATAPAVRQEEAIDKIGSINDYEKFVAGLRA